MMQPYILMLGMHDGLIPDLSFLDPDETATLFSQQP
jgi:hypothetical protein